MNDKFRSSSHTNAVEKRAREDMAAEFKACMQLLDAIKKEAAAEVAFKEAAF
jgi:hypothetical protein